MLFQKSKLPDHKESASELVHRLMPMPELSDRDHIINDYFHNMQQEREQQLKQLRLKKQ